MSPQPMSPRSSSAVTLGARVGYAGGTALTSIDEVRAGAMWADQVGFDSYWVSYVFGVDPLVALPLAAADAPAIELGTSVIPTVGRHPISMAQLARTAQQACGGRFTLGIGPSHQIVVEALYGEQWNQPLERTREYLDILVPLCNGEPAAVSGNQITGHATVNVPSAPVPVVLAALGPKMLDLAGRVATGTHLGRCGPKTIREHSAPVINAAAADAGREPPRIIALVEVCVTNDPAGVRAAAAPGAANYAALPSYKAMLDREGVADPTDLILAGSFDQIMTGLAEYVEAGATDLRLGVSAPDDSHAQATRDALAEWLASPS